MSNNLVGFEPATGPAIPPMRNATVEINLGVEQQKLYAPISMFKMMRVIAEELPELSALDLMRLSEKLYSVACGE